MLSISRLNSRDTKFVQEFERWLRSNETHEQDVSDVVKDIIEQIRKRGDSALIEFTQQFDRLTVSRATDLEIPHAQLESAFQKLNKPQQDALRFAHQRVFQYAEKQKIEDWNFDDAHGSCFGQRVTAIDRAGIYVPGGKAAYPSSVLMNAVPAKVAGVDEIIMVVPTPGGEVNNMVLAAAFIAGVDRVFRVGGAQAVAALAYGTETIPRVDKIVGPGNAYVASAKRQVFGQVGIDMIAGPSEVLVIADSSANPEWIAMDLFSQAEHDEWARATLVSVSPELTNRVYDAMNQAVSRLERSDIIRASVEQCGALIDVETLEDAARLANQIAPEHLELCVENPDALMVNIRHAGAIFVGHYSPEVFGDYCAGPNHVLPTSTTARFSSPLGVYDFQKRSSVIRCTAEGAKQLSTPASILAHSEGLTAHAKSAELRGQDV